MSALDKELVANLLMGLDAIDERVERASPSSYCDTVTELEQYHDALVQEVRNLVGMVRSALAPLAAAAIDGSARS